MDYIVAAANLRAAMYGIKGKHWSTRNIIMQLQDDTL